MQFDKKYFQDEIREGFLVDSRMKHYWAAKIEVLEEVAKVCKRNNITWYADWGTLLGSVRHKGFIPWDDDIDIAMKRKDYELFLKVAPLQLPEYYGVFDSTTDMFRVENAVSVSNWNKSSLVLTKERLQKYHGCPFVVGIDIFPLDYLSSDEEQEKFRQKALKEIWDAMAAIDVGIDINQIEQRVLVIEKVLQVKVDWEKDLKRLRKELLKLSDIILSIFAEDGADEVAELRWLMLRPLPNAHYKKEWYEDIVYMPFEGFQMPVPIGYDKILTKMYGDYMTPVQGKAAHEYPQYKGQLSLIEEWKKSVGETRDIDEIVMDLI